MLPSGAGVGADEQVFDFSGFTALDPGVGSDTAASAASVLVAAPRTGLVPVHSHGDSVEAFTTFESLRERVKILLLRTAMNFKYRQWILKDDNALRQLTDHFRSEYETLPYRGTEVEESVSQWVCKDADVATAFMDWVMTG